MRWRKTSMGAVSIAVLLVALVSTVAQTPPVRVTATARAGKVTSGEVLLNGSTVIVITSPAGGLSPLRRAEVVADRLNQVLSIGALPPDFLVAEQTGGWTVHAKGISIVTASAADARALKTTPERLAKYWRDTIIDRMQILFSEAHAESATATTKGNEISNVEEERELRQEDTKEDTIKTAARPSREDTQVQVPTSKKIVPIISVGQGINIGAAQVVGPSFRVDAVKAVAQIEADFKRAAGARIRAMVPVSTERIVSNLTRVDQVAVSMYGDVDPRKLF